MAFFKEIDVIPTLGTYHHTIIDQTQFLYSKPKPKPKQNSHNKNFDKNNQ
jgi:hypothetical protein